MILGGDLLASSLCCVKLNRVLEDSFAGYGSSNCKSLLNALFTSKRTVSGCLSN